MSRILNDKDRADLMTKYKDDRLKDAPHNITDKTLIENYGNDAQKALLQKAGGGVAPAKQEPQAKENKTSNTNPASDGTIEGESETEKAEKERAFEVAEYERLHGEKPAENFPTDEIRAANLTKAKELEAEAAKGSGDNTAYLDAFNQYVKLHDGKAPAKEFTTEQLVEANNKRVEELKNVQATPKGKAQTPAQKAPAKVEANNTVKGVDMVELYNTKTNETKSFSRFTWENYMKGKEKDWQLKPTEPEEVQGL